MPMILHIATSNPGKLRDFALAASGSPGIRIEPLPGLAAIPPPAEDEPTFEGNARTKAIFYSGFAPGEIVLADDSGLEVACLDNAPGVRSARYADDVGFPTPAAATPDQRNNAALLRALDGVPEDRRHARYRCVLAAARDGRIVGLAEGTVEGAILSVPRGNSGFGYDPLFLLPSLGRTMAELTPTHRLELSHRGNALREMLRSLTKEPSA